MQGFFTDFGKYFTVYVFSEPRPRASVFSCFKKQFTTMHPPNKRNPTAPMPCHKTVGLNLSQIHAQTSNAATIEVEHAR
jgi:hypothetical protein